MKKTDNLITQTYCLLVGAVGLLVYCILNVLGSSNDFFVAKIIAITVALIAYAIKCVMDVVNKEKIWFSLCMTLICITDLVMIVVL